MSSTLRRSLGTVLLGLAAVYLVGCLGFLVATGGGDLALGPARITIRSLNVPLQQFLWASLLGALLLSEGPRPTAWFSRPQLYSMALLTLITLSFAARCMVLNTPPLDFHPVRQYFDLRIAGALYHGTSASEAPLHGEIEPSVIERLTLPLYCFGGESLWAPRLVAIVTFLIGAVPLYLLIRDRGGPDLAITTAALYLFLPYSLQAGTSYQPDPLMLSLLLYFACFLDRWLRVQHPMDAFAAALSASLAIFVKLPAILFATAVVACLAPTCMRRAKFWGVATAALLPALIFLVWKTQLGSGDAPRAAYYLQQGRLLTSAFYVHLYDMLKDCYKPVLLVVTVAAIWLARKSEIAPIFYGFLGGQLLYCIVFPFHVSTHSYYSLPLLPVVALACAVVIHRLAGPGPRTAAWLAVLVVACIYGWQQSIEVLQPARTAARYAEIGRAVGGSAHTLFIAHDYGLPLIYHGRFEGALFEPDEIPERDLVAVFEDRLRTLRPEYVVVEDFSQLDDHPELRKFLLERYPAIAQVRGRAGWLVLPLVHGRQATSSAAPRPAQFSRRRPFWPLGRTAPRRCYRSGDVLPRPASPCGPYPTSSRARGRTGCHRGQWRGRRWRNISTLPSLLAPP